MKCLKFEHKKELRFGSRVSLRDFFVKRAISENKGIKVVHSGETMTLSPEDLRLKGVHNKNSMQVAKFSNSEIKAGDTYYLIDYTFNPDGKTKVKTKEVKQQSLFGGIS